MEFSTEWIEKGPNASKEERATLCDLRIFVAGENACHFSAPEAGRTFDCVTVPAVHLAEGLATDWWSIFGGRDREYPIRRYRTGFALPDLVFRCDGSTFEALGNQLSYGNPRLRFWQVEKEDIPRAEAEAALAEFIGSVVERLHGSGLRDSETVLRWSRVSESLNDADETAFCEAAGALGTDPYAITGGTAHLIEEAGEKFAGEALIEFLAGLGKTEQPASILDWVSQVENRPQCASRLPDLPAVAEEIGSVAQPKPGERGWAAGYRAAKALRTALDLPAYQGVTPDKFAAQLGGKKFEPAPDVKGIHALVSRSNDEVHIHLRDRGGADWALKPGNFTFARAVGDAICFQDGRRSVVNDLRHAERQATGRAFSAEFLAPVESVLDMLDGGRDIDEISATFNVSPLVVEHQVENRNRIQEATAWVA